MRRWRPARIANTVSVSATRTGRPLPTRRPQPLPPRKRLPPGAPCLRIWTATNIRCRPSSDGPPVFAGDDDASAPTPEVPEAEPQKGQPAPPQNVAEKRSDFWNNFQKKRDGESKGKGGIAAATHVDGTDVPWEEPKRYNLFMALYQTILRVMFNAPRFFAALPATNGKLTRPLVFYLILGMFQTLVERMWYLMSIQASGPSITDPKLQEVLGDVAQRHEPAPDHPPDAGHPCHPALFLRVGLLPHMLRLAQPENVQFRTVFRVIAYSAAPTVVCIVPLVGPLVGSIWFGVCCFIGCKYSMRLPWSRTGLALGPLYLIAFAIGMQLIRQFLSMSA